MANKYSETVMEALKFFNLDNVPHTMKELNSQYRKLSLKVHPDKNNGSEESKEQFQLLHMHWRTLGNEVLANNCDVNNVSEDERFNMDLFKEFNKDQRNMESHTVIIEDELAEIWALVLEARYGKPETKEGGCGLIFRHWINSTLKFTITLYVKPKTDPRSKLHIQSPSQRLNNDYVFAFPVLFVNGVILTN